MRGQNARLAPVLPRDRHLFAIFVRRPSAPSGGGTWAVSPWPGCLRTTWLQPCAGPV